MLASRSFHLIFSYRVNYTGKVEHGTITRLKIENFRLKTLLNLCAIGKCLSHNNESFLPISVATLQLYGGLNHTVFCSLCLLRFQS